MKKLFPTKEEFKTLLITGTLLLAVFLPITLYLTSEIDPQLDEVYLEVYGMDEEGAEW